MLWVILWKLLTSIDIFSGQRWKPKKGLSSTERFFIIKTDVGDEHLSASTPTISGRIGHAGVGRSWANPKNWALLWQVKVDEYCLSLSTFLPFFWKVLLGNVVPPSFHHRTDGPWPSNFAGGWRSLARSSSHGHGGSSSLCGPVLPS